MSDKTVKIRFFWVCIFLFAIMLTLGDISSRTLRIAVALETMAARPVK